MALVMVFLFIQPSVCSAKQALQVPEVLQPWVNWVLHGQEEQLDCIPRYNDAETLLCGWPSTLDLSLNDQGGTFSQTWLIHHEMRVALPGSPDLWPREIAVDGTGGQVLLQENESPGLVLTPGRHTISGRFFWNSLPESLTIPAESGLVSLMVNQEKIEFPNLDESGELWLKNVPVEEKLENQLRIESFRRIDDAIPATILLHFTLDVSGSARQITLGPLYDPEKSTPLALESPLPAKLEQDGRLLVQVRPGQYTLTLRLRHAGPLDTLSFFKPADDFWPGEEIWSFHAQPDLRLVEIEGGASVDPLQTSMPQDWQNFPAYRILPGESLVFKEIKRGDPQPAPDQLSLDRSLWLRFDGSGYTLQDRINGVKNTRWRLDMDPAITPGRVAVDGNERLITRREASDKAGVELRNGVVNLTAVSTLKGKISTLPATGWDHDFQQVKGRLHLPPGWKLLHASGIDNIPGTWIKRWTLLDIFVVLIFTIALAKLFSKPLAGIALITLVLIYHEPGAPRYVWVALLAGYALIRYLPPGKFRKAVQIYQILAVLSLIIIAIPYSVEALRVGIYPQLARPWDSMTEHALVQEVATTPPSPASPMAALEEMSTMDEMSPEMEEMDGQREDKGLYVRKRTLSKSMASLPEPSGSRGAQVAQYDPKALTQTGPGMPGWLPFETVNFSWSGPVTRDQSVSFALIGPTTNLILAFVRVFLIIVLALGMFGLRFKTKSGFHFTNLEAFKVFALAGIMLMCPALVRSAEIPSPEMLAELQTRLLEKDECFPACSDIAGIHVAISPARLSMDLEIHTRLDAAVPVPGHAQHWLPVEVMLDDQPAQGLFRTENTLWILVPAGQHRVRMAGPVPKQNTLQIPFPIKPRSATVSAEGWITEGIHPDGALEDQLQFKRIVEQDTPQTEILETGILPPFALVERNLLLGLEWKIQTTVQRLSPTGSGVVLDIPLMKGESVITEGIRVQDGMAKISLGADETRKTWESFLAPGDSILLEHGKTSAWTEIWKVDVSPIFHLEYEGIPVILHKTGTRWYPTWHPWPGESVTLNISRPAGIDGQTLTLEKSHLVLKPGRKTTAANLLLSINSSQGGRHDILLPPDAQLQEVAINGAVQPIRQEKQKVSLPITPGHQEIKLSWMESRGMSTNFKSSPVNLGAPSVNASVDVHLPGNRWPLFTGGEQLAGPAVLFWSVIIIVFLLALGLSKTGWTPLKFHHWFLLGIGLSMSTLASGLIVAGWLIALNFREKGDSLEGQSFNLMQAGLAALTVIALGQLVFAVSSGLLGHPDMNIIGNGSNSGLLRWYQDVSAPSLPGAWVFSIPMFFYRIAMLAWALWLSFWLVGTLKWGWRQFTSPKIWAPRQPRMKKGKGPNSESSTLNP
jgi:hypothetical protein